MRRTVIAAVVGMLLGTGTGTARGDVLYEVVARTTDLLTRGTVELEDTVTVSVKGDRLRQEVKGARSVVTRRGARYSKPGHRVTLDQLDRGVRYDINLDAGTYTEESLARVRQEQEEVVAAAEKAFRVNLSGAPPTLAVLVERPGERREVLGRECERVVLKATAEVVTVAGRGDRATGGAPSRFGMTFDVCLGPETATFRDTRALEERVDEATGQGGVLAERQLRVFAARRDVLAVFELMQRLIEREQQKLGGTPLRWERTFVGPRRGEPQATLYRYRGEVTRIEDRALDAAAFELPAGLTRDARPRSVRREGTD